VCAIDLSARQLPCDRWPTLCMMIAVCGCDLWVPSLTPRTRVSTGRAPLAMPDRPLPGALYAGTLAQMVANFVGHYPSPGPAPAPRPSTPSPTFLPTASLVATCPTKRPKGKAGEGGPADRRWSRKPYRASVSVGVPESS